MAKLKTRQAVAKRFKITKTGKVLKKVAGQDHFNSREPGKVTRQKRTLTNLSLKDQVNVKRFIAN